MSSPIWKFRRSKSRFRAAYTKAGLAELMNVTKRQARHILRQANVTPRRLGNRDYYFLRDIREALPELWESLRLKRELDAAEEEAA